MPQIRMKADDKQARDQAEAWRLAPQLLLHNLAEAYGEIGRYDLERLNAEQLSGGSGLNMRNAGARKSFKYKASDPDQVTDFRQLFVDEYSRWPAAGMHERGGVIKASRTGMWILNHLARGASGRRRLTDADIRQGLRDGSFRMVWLPYSGRTALMDMGTDWGSTSGRYRHKAKGKGSIIAFLYRQVRMKKRLDWEGLVKRNSSIHEQLIAAAAEKTLAAVLGGGQ